MRGICFLQRPSVMRSASTSNGAPLAPCTVVHVGEHVCFVMRPGGRSWVARWLRKACLLGPPPIGSFHGIVSSCSYACARILCLTCIGFTSWAQLLTLVFLCPALYAHYGLPITWCTRGYLPHTSFARTHDGFLSLLSFGLTEPHADVHNPPPAKCPHTRVLFIQDDPVPTFR